MALTVLDATRHSDLRLKKNSDFSFARERMMVPVWGQEIPQAARFFPVVFMPKDGTWIPMALMGLQQGQNPCVSAKGKWLADYIPAVLRAHPFYSIDSAEGEPVLGIDEEDPALTREVVLEEESLALFEDDGEPSELTCTALRVLEQIRAQQQTTWAVTDILAELGLLVPWQPRGQASGTASSQLYAVDEAAIKALDDESFLRLREPGALPLIYSHLVSLKRFETLEKQQSQLWLAATQGASNALFSQNSDLFVFGE
ncbi:MULTISPECIES: SapC family protein [Halomonadaceae]|nr:MULTISPECIES: SapC family protein [Halomonas]